MTHLLQKSEEKDVIVLDRACGFDKFWLAHLVLLSRIGLKVKGLFSIKHVSGCDTPTSCKIKKVVD